MRKLRVIALASVALYLASVASGFAASPWCSAAPAKGPAPEFRRFLPQLIGHTTIPVLLPSWLPQGTTGRWCGGYANPDHYMVWLPDKEEILDNAPHDAESVYAQRVGLKTPPEEGVRTALSGGRVGYYQASEMAARSSGAWIDWTQNGVRYTVGEYAGIKEDLVRMANSVVAVGTAGEIPPALRPALPKLRRSGFTHILLPTYLPPFGKPLPGWQNLTPVMSTEAFSDSYLISFYSPNDKYDDTLATLEADKVVPQLGSLTGDPVNLWMSQPATSGKKRLFRGRSSAADPKDPSTSALIRWDESGFRYQMTWRGASVMQMVRMAESCVSMSFSGSAQAKGVLNGKK